MVLLLLASCSQGSESPKPPGGAGGAAKPPARKARVTVATATARDIVAVVEASGSIEASEEISIPAQVTGVIDSVSFKEGAVVDEKTVLVEIDLEKFRLAVARAKAECDHADAQTVLMQTLYDNRLKLFEEGKRLKKEWLTEEQMAQWSADLAKAKADVARATVDQDLAKRELARAQVRSPIAGLINRKLVSKGEYVRVDTIVATILNVTPMHVRFSVPEIEASRLVKDQEVEFAVRSVPDQVFKAKLFYLNQKADASTRTTECKAEILGDASKLRPGFFATVTVTVKAGQRKGIVVPERAVLPTERGFVVFRLNGTKAVQVVVKLGLRTKDGIEIVEGIAEGAQVAVDGATAVRDGMDVEVVTEPPRGGESK